MGLALGPPRVQAGGQASDRVQEVGLVAALGEADKLGQPTVGACPCRVTQIGLGRRNCHPPGFAG